MNVNANRQRDWPLTICVQALGGQGGGVLVDWIVDLAEGNGFIAQSTSVAGVGSSAGAGSTAGGRRAGSGFAATSLCRRSVGILSWKNLRAASRSISASSPKPKSPGMLMRSLLVCREGRRCSSG